MDDVSSVASIVFASLEDEIAMHRCPSDSDAATRFTELGAREVVVKSGADGALLVADGRTEHVHAARVEQVVDTTAAGDAFAGGYLAARVARQSPAEAGRVAARVAAAVVSHAGAIIPRTVRLLSARPLRARG